jgi:cytochrome c biogenesis protein CcdA/thiol-disulfide isomerase/thioredoxin
VRKPDDKRINLNIRKTRDVIMKKVGVIAVLLCIALVLGIFILAAKSNTIGAVATGNNEVTLYKFYGKGCPHCIRLTEFLDELSAKYPTLKIIEHEVYFDQENRDLFQKMSDAFGKEIGGVPTVFIDDKIIVGFSPAIGKEIEKEIQRCLVEGCASPTEHVPETEAVSIVTESSPTEEPGRTKLKGQITLGAVISAAAVDAVNPCAFAVLIILLTAILAARNKRRALFAGLAFTSSIFLSYFLMGIGLYSAIQVAKLNRAIYVVAAILAIILGISNLKKYSAYKHWFSIAPEKSLKPKLKCFISGITSVPGAFLTGFVVSLFLLPCTSGPYIIILGLLAKTATRNYALLLLVLYNLIFILPMLLITFAVSWGYTTTKKTEKWRLKKLNILRLVAGLIILALGVGMIIALWLGYV